MENAQQHTCCSRHMDTKHFSFLDWFGQDLILMKQINIPDNTSDDMTKALGYNLFYNQNDYILGKIIPSYAVVYVRLDLLLILRRAIENFSFLLFKRTGGEGTVRYYRLPFDRIKKLVT